MKFKVDKRKEADTLFSVLFSSIKTGGRSLKNIPALIVRIINEDLWQERIDKTGKLVTYTSFEEYITTEPMKGLGIELDTLKKLCRDNPVALDAIDRVTVKHGNNQYTKPKVDSDNVTIHTVARGNSNQYALRRLRKNRPDLHERVLNKQISAHAAMVEAGFRKVPTPYQRAVKACERLTTQERVNLIKHLQEMENTRGSVKHGKT